MSNQKWICPTCAKQVPSNEWFAYGRHEDCAMNRKPCTTDNRIPAVLRNPIYVHAPGANRSDNRAV